MLLAGTPTGLGHGAWGMLAQDAALPHAHWGMEMGTGLASAPLLAQTRGLPRASCP